MKLQTTKTLAIISIALYGLLVVMSILFALFVIDKTFILATISPEELEATPFPYLRYLLYGTVVFSLLIALLFMAYQVLYTLVFVGTIGFKKKTTMILLIIGYFVWVVALVGLIMTLVHKDKDESKQLEN
ncbi:MAG TPA: hypothetical protein PKY72_05595 [Bacilli bacterium]|nr:hypothetical protein [Bacilli bacterium]HOC98171.1 hypothetical protein [Bacilli bacterium]HOH58965.1 hypothetical protein [Bacilli bacterium]HQQ39754.1 hypothetical protein [Bacilli bacterium]